MPVSPTYFTKSTDVDVPFPQGQLMGILGLTYTGSEQPNNIELAKSSIVTITSFGKATAITPTYITKS